MIVPFQHSLPAVWAVQSIAIYHTQAICRVSLI